MFFDSDTSHTTELHACEHCGLFSAQQYAHVDRHGDIEQLCRRCYCAALEAKESPELARRDRIAAGAMLTIGALAILFWLTGCATRPHVVEHRMVAGKSVEIHTDAPEAMEPPCPEPWAGCHYGNRIFFRSAYVRQGMVEHELAHAEGMQHGEWEKFEFMKARCTTVTVAGRGYKVGQVICNRADGEVVFTDSTMQEVAA